MIARRRVIGLRFPLTFGRGPPLVDTRGPRPFLNLLAQIVPLAPSRSLGRAAPLLPEQCCCLHGTVACIRNPRSIADPLCSRLQTHT